LFDQAFFGYLGGPLRPWNRIITNSLHEKEYRENMKNSERRNWKCFFISGFRVLVTQSDVIVSKWRPPTLLAHRERRSFLESWAVCGKPHVHSSLLIYQNDFKKRSMLEKTPIEVMTIPSGATTLIRPMMSVPYLIVLIRTIDNSTTIFVSW